VCKADLLQQLQAGEGAVVEGAQSGGDEAHLAQARRVPEHARRQRPQRVHRQVQRLQILQPCERILHLMPRWRQNDWLQPHRTRTLIGTYVRYTAIMTKAL
jgi:hypothetical protein